MPLRNQPPSLQRAAMAVICENFEPLCYGSTAEEVAGMIDDDQYLSVRGPFMDMPPLLVEEMSEELKHLTHLRRQHLHLLTTPRVSCWTLQGVADQLTGLQFLASRCKNLKHLNLSYLRHINPNVLGNLIPSFATLVTLNLRMTLTVDQLLAQVGRHCPVLRELNLTGTPISDRGLVQLCISTEGRRQCQKLQKLSVSETCVSASGAAVVLQSLPCLADFDFDNIFEAVEMVEQWDRALEARLLTPAGVRLSEQPVGPPEVLQLRALSSAAEFVAADSLDAAVRLCPFAHSVSISNSWLPSEALYKFMVLENLTALALTNGEGLTLDFQEGVLPLLSACGDRLQNLILANFTDVDVASIGRTCPRLLNLALSAIGQLETVNTVNPAWFSQLQALEVWVDTTRAHAQGHEQSPSPCLLKQLLVSKGLKNLLFTACAALTDQLLYDVWRDNPMRQLSHLTLDHCHGISPLLVHQILGADNNLTMLRFWSCCQINKSHSTEFSKRINSENMNVYFEWFAYND